MAIVQGFHDLVDDGGGISLTEFLELVDRLDQIQPINVLGNNVKALLVHVRVIDLDDVRVVDLLQHLHLIHNPIILLLAQAVPFEKAQASFRLRSDMIAINNLDFAADAILPPLPDHVVFLYRPALALKRLATLIPDTVGHQVVIVIRFVFGRFLIRALFATQAIHEMIVE